MQLIDFVHYCSCFICQSVRSSKHWELISTGGSPFLRLVKTYEFRNLPSRKSPVVNSNFIDLTIGNDPSSADHGCGELCSVEYHVVFNESYGVPMLLFNIYREYLGRMNMEDTWDALELSKEASSSKQYETLTMVEHPLLFRPFLCLHPCKTNDILSSLKSGNPIITFLSTYGRFVNLNVSDLPTYDCEFGES
ncbi:ubiquitin-like-conjugating enzyme ATG10 [Anopheles ziemanni]|uniref:ubiquitin-like-conjugating enzyme ATG10 n=1 Tax=Anopheles coustani TaxID=139045 RepID=UPI002658093B|nr:ubiquitin-like-conjugating enzyme ATG10 [Anopheles coustani]XP_058176438.1 ubiquitin-like-conjugating enzyme ATG10 [Anopheles ziemanni]